MIFQKILNRTLIFLVITAVVDFISLKFYLYWTIPWIDIIPHFFGGLTVGLASIWLFSHESDLSKWSNRRRLLTALTGAVAVGVIWEIFELHFGITSLSDGIHYVTDTASDLTMDFVGGIIGFFIVRNLLEKYEK